MITEDYVSFEIAKLLKEKGFIIPYDSFRGVYINGMFKRLNPGSGYGYNSEDEVIAVCSLQLAMKWLRNQHNLHIMVDCIGSKNYMSTIQFICNSKDIKVESDENKICGNGFDSFEEACEAAIKYCLEKLI